MHVPQAERVQGATPTACSPSSGGDWLRQAPPTHRRPPATEARKARPELEVRHMSIHGIASVTYAVEDVELCARFFTDFGLYPREVSEKGAMLTTQEGQEVRLR